MASTVASFTARLLAAEQSWDDLRRNSYSSPGRWVQTLDMSRIPFTEQRSELLEFDTDLTQLFSLVPSLTHLKLNPAMPMSQRAILALALRSESACLKLKTIAGIRCIVPPDSPVTASDDAFVQLLYSSPNLEEIELFGTGLEPVVLIQPLGDVRMTTPFRPLTLPFLHTLNLLSMASSPVMYALLRAHLPVLKKLRITPYHDIPFPSNLTSRFITVHGPKLDSLHLETINSWPTRMHPSPQDLLETAPNLNHLSLENPIPALTFGNMSDPHQLRILSIPRPKTGLVWTFIENILPHLPQLAVIRAREVRWLRAGVKGRALEAGVQGEMREWRRKLARRGIKMLDADWKE